MRIFCAFLLSFNIFITPIAAIASTYRTPESTARLERHTDHSANRGANGDIFAKPLEAESSLPAPKAEPAPLPFAPPVGAVTASLTATLTPGAGGDVDGDGKADPGDTIAYSLTISNTSGAGAAGLQLSNPLDSHTTLVPGTLNSTPVAFDQSVTTDEDTGVSITIQGQDPDGSNLTFNSIVGPTHGSLGAFSAPSCDGAGVCSSTATYTPSANYNGPDSITFKVNDGTANSNENGTVSITVNAVNDAPTVTAPAGPLSATEDTQLTINGGNLISVADVDAGGSSEKVTLGVVHGTLTLASLSGITFVDGTANGTASLHFTGTIANLNTALNGLKYQGTQDYNSTRGAETLSININDQGNTGSGGALSASASFGINVAAVDG